MVTVVYQAILQALLHDSLFSLFKTKAKSIKITSQIRESTEAEAYLTKLTVFQA